MFRFWTTDRDKCLDLDLETQKWSEKIFLKLIIIKISKFLAIENLGLDPGPTLDYPNSLDPNSDLKSKDPKHWFPVPYCFLGFNDCRERLLIQKKSQRSVKFQMV